MSELQDRITEVGQRLRQNFDKAAQGRSEEENRWLRNLRHYYGMYSVEELDEMKRVPGSRSRIFMKLTKVKVRAYDSRMLQLLFPANSEKNWQISTTPVPETGAEIDALVAQAENVALAQALQQAGLDPDLADAEKAAEKIAAVAGRGAEAEQQMTDALTLVAQIRDAMKQQYSREQYPAIAVKFAREACEKMEQEMADQLAEVQYRSIAKRVLHQGNLFGTGILKAPLVERSRRPKKKLTANGWVTEYVEIKRPFVDAVSCWDFYPDPDARCLEECECLFQYHAMNRLRLQKLAADPRFDGKLILDYLREHAEGDANARPFESQISQLKEDKARVTGRHYAVIECWVPLSAAELESIRPKPAVALDAQALEATLETQGEAAVVAEIEQSLTQAEAEQALTWVSVWLLGPHVIFVDGSALDSERYPHPYHTYHFDKPENSFWGEGVASEMESLLVGLNASVRMTLDNASATIGAIWEVDSTNLLPGEMDKPPVPGQVYFKMGQAQAVRSHETGSRISETMALSKMFEEAIHESTLPAYMHADAGVGGAGRTASGLSMLMGAANLQITDQVANWDEGITRPAIGALYDWNMTHNPRKDIKGDFTVVASGSTSLVAKEVRANQMLGLLNASANPLDQMFINRRLLWEEVVKAQDISVDGLVRSEEEVNERGQLEQTITQLQQQLAATHQLLAEATKAAPGVLADVAQQLDQMNSQEVVNG